MEIETNAGQIVIKKANFCSIFNSDTNFKKNIIECRKDTSKIITSS